MLSLNNSNVKSASIVAAPEITVDTPFAVSVISVMVIEPLPALQSSDPEVVNAVISEVAFVLIISSVAVYAQPVRMFVARTVYSLAARLIASLSLVPDSVAGAERDVDTPLPANHSNV